MTLLEAQRGCELLLGCAFVQQSIEHVFGPLTVRWLFVPRLLLALLLIAGVAPLPVLSALFVLGLAALVRFDGAYNGGSDRLGLLLLFCLLAARALPDSLWSEVALGYLAVQLLLSYFSAGWVKFINPEWRSGRALRDVFMFSVYPVSESLRGWQHWPRLLCGMSCGVILLEVLFPLALFDARALWLALLLAGLFHLANAVLFGLNRFLWVWLAAYPALFWFQGRLGLQEWLRAQF